MATGAEGECLRERREARSTALEQATGRAASVTSSGVLFEKSDSRGQHRQLARGPTPTLVAGGDDGSQNDSESLQSARQLQLRVEQPRLRRLCPRTPRTGAAPKRVVTGRGAVQCHHLLPSHPACSEGSPRPKGWRRLGLLCPTAGAGDTASAATNGVRGLGGGDWRGVIGPESLWQVRRRCGILLQLAQ